MRPSLGLLALAIGSALAQEAAVASTESSSKAVKALDIHHHFVPDCALVPTTGGSPTPAWTIQSTFAALQSVGADRAVISLSTPGTDVDPGNCTLAASIAIRANDEAAGYSAKFSNVSWYMHLPIGCDAAVKTELARASKLKPKALGYAILTSYAGNKYMGDDAFKPVYDAANSNGGVIFVHPRDPLQKCSDDELVSANPNPRILSAGVEFYQDTARGFGDLIRAGFLTSYSKIRWIAPQMGGNLPSSLDRLLSVLRFTPDQIAAQYDALRTRVFWESAGPTYPHQAASVLSFGILPKQWLFGTDFPYAPPPAILDSRARIDDQALLNTASRNDVLRNNAVKLLGL